MIVFHLSWDLAFLGLLDLRMSGGFWPWFSRLIATTFLLCVGVSLTLSYNRGGRDRGFAKYLVRGLRVFGLGLVITAVTYVFIGRGFVVFGILHLIGFSIVAAYPFLPFRRRYVSLIVGIALILLGVRLNRELSTTPWLIWLGISEIGRPMVDYYPVLPWFGIVLVSVTIGHALYPGGTRRFSLPDLPGTPVIRPFCFLGRHALLVYVIHQPILLGILYGIAWVLARQ